MSDGIKVVFLGINDAGMRIYEWLCNRKNVDVKALLTTKEQLSLIPEIVPDYVVSVGFRHLVPSDILSVPTEGCLNVHPAMLPYNRGANPNVWPIVDGTPAGVTLHYMDEALDTGDIIAQREVETQFSDSAKDLYERLEDVQFELFSEYWPRVVAGETSPTQQPPNEGTFHTTSEFDDLCSLDSDATYTVKELINILRALTFPPYDNARLEVDGTEYTVDVNIEEI